MREAAHIVLSLMRYANREGIALGNTLPMLIDTLQLTYDEMTEIGELIKADIREAHAMRPGYEDINERMKRMGPDNPHGI